MPHSCPFKCLTTSIHKRRNHFLIFSHKHQIPVTFCVCYFSAFNTNLKYFIIVKCSKNIFYMLIFLTLSTSSPFPIFPMTPSTSVMSIIYIYSMCPSYFGILPYIQFPYIFCYFLNHFVTNT